ncbi:50S ribosomal protein L18 [Candidatus Nomurabacteria bacterium RIFCSPHIGHO2_02_FULL_33_12]|jgi:large subunit ribosomal protein L18|uniref:Large ribosomal subunit protein uL18 n=1 Tax=Candidatus Nomurabacteria bacterium RIFCSPLOWO2_01_FULL_33_17 TaxID=1801764 RepID=A0A1F6WPQ0_9BACT|nr:MAG: 50S ribosomal protein L18 [Candidatus Nomurabacteria bacterium RIFCSPHIGHO2_02_FULL_33_12]OGI83837.1 MAG: 50S ribosomal protein L18 [Candidatus Nomurabacteria bacterium RIFCSPLOWO2_01_FULL_33_17]
MKTTNIKQEKRIRLKRKIRSKINGTPLRPRLSVFKSNMHIYAQIIDDVTGKTLLATSDMKETKGTYRERAIIVGKAIAEEAIKKGIKNVVFDRNGYKYTGHIAALADASRESGLTF